MAAKAIWTAKVYQGTGGIYEYQSLDQIRKDAPYIMGLHKRGTKEMHKYIAIFKGKYDPFKDYSYVIQFSGWSADPTRLTMAMTPKGKSWETIGYIQKDPITGVITYRPRGGKEKVLR